MDICVGPLDSETIFERLENVDDGDRDCYDNCYDDDGYYYNGDCRCDDDDRYCDYYDCGSDDGDINFNGDCN